MPDINMFERLNRASGNQVKLVGVAPERPGAQGFISKVSRICSVSLAHTAADYNTAMHAYACGATHTTHLFNAMNGLHHRQPAVIGAAFDSGAYAELICDGIHVHPSVIRMAFKLFEDKLILVSDSVRGAGMPDGSYDLGGQTFTVKDGKATLKDNTIAGSTMHLLQAVRNAISYGITPGTRHCCCYYCTGQNDWHGCIYRFAFRWEMGRYVASGFAISTGVNHYQRRGYQQWSIRSLALTIKCAAGRLI